MHDHLVEFYETDEQITESVRNFLAPALQSGGSAMIIATPDHRRSFNKGLTDAGIDLTIATRQGRYTTLDAGDTLAQFMVEDLPHPTRFFEVVGRVIHELPEYGTPRLYGEMVSLLWAGGNIAGAIALEGLWNRLAGIYDFKLLCAYPLSLFNPASDSTAFWEVCGDHTEVRLRFADIPPFDNDLGSLKEVLRNVQRMESLSRGRLVAEPGAAGFTYEMRRGSEAV